jgi:hypothetical protein
LITGSCGAAVEKNRDLKLLKCALKDEELSGLGDAIELLDELELLLCGTPGAIERL